MPRIEPSAGPTGWPSAELTIGVVGVAPFATLDFCRALYQLVPAGKDWHHPRVLIDANSKIPSRGRHFDLGEADPSPAIRATIGELAAAGAGVVVVPCNTAHLLFDRWAADAPVPVPHILQVTIDRVVALGGSRVAALESASLRARGGYLATAGERGLGTVPIDPDEARDVDRVIASIKLHGQPTADDHAIFERLAAALHRRGADALVLGCTELGGFAARAPTGLRAVDSNRELARAALIVARCAVREDA